MVHSAETGSTLMCSRVRLCAVFSTQSGSTFMQHSQTKCCFQQIQAPHLCSRIRFYSFFAEESDSVLYLAETGSNFLCSRVLPRAISGNSKTNKKKHLFRSKQNVTRIRSKYYTDVSYNNSNKRSNSKQINI
jgi:hypothetical protein